MPTTYAGAAMRHEKDREAPEYRDPDSLAEYLRYLAYKGAIERYGADPEIFEVPLEMLEADYEAQTGGGADYPELDLRKRIDWELEVIEQAGFPGYFLIVADLLRFCRENDIPTGPGRGSVCGSVVAYTTYITDVDPIRWGIPFERFLHLERIAMPDVDLDICQARRQEVIEYLRSKYGEENVAQIITFGTLMARGVVKDVVRILHIDEQIYGIQGNPTGARLSEMIPEGSGADQVKLREFIEEEQGQAFLQAIEPLRVEAFGRECSVLDTCLRLEGTRKHSSVHAAGVVIADRPLIELAPLYRRNKDSEVQVSYDMRDLETIGLLKFDVLGLRTVTVIGEAERYVRQQDPGFRIKEVSLDDPETFKLLQAGDTGGVFQLEGDGITAAFTGIVPDRFEDIVAILALYRPGPMEQLPSYIHRKHGQEEVSYAHPDLESVLGSTYGLIVYQEQVMGIVRTLGGYTAGAADMFRKAIGKKLPELIRREIDAFYDAAVTRGYDEKMVREVSEQIAYFGRYGFNLGHATGYAYITYWTAYLKANHPTEWFCSLLNSYVDDPGKLAGVLREAARHGVEVLAPDINRSGRGFTIDGPGVVRFGLEAVKGLGSTAAQQIVEERDEETKTVLVSKKEKRFNEEKNKEYIANLRVPTRVSNEPRPYDGVEDFCARLPSLPVNVKQSLAVAGAFTTDIEERRLLHAAMPKLNDAAKKGKPYDWRSVTPELSELDLIRAEREAVGFYVTAHPLEMQREFLDQYGAIYEGVFEELPGMCTIAGLVLEVKTHEARNGQMAWVTVENGVHGMPRITIFANLWKSISSLVRKDSVLVVRGIRDDHPKFGWGFKAEAVKVLDKSRPSAQIVRVILPNTELGDIYLLAGLLGEWADPDGIQYQAVVETQGRACLLSIRGRAILTGAALAKLTSLGWDVQLDPVQGVTVPIRGEEYRPSTPYKGRNRVPTWELSLVRIAMEQLDATFLTELQT